MESNVTVIFPDFLIGVSGEFLKINSLVASNNERVIQWHPEYKHIEYEGDAPNKPLSEGDYDEYVLPYVTLWQDEKARLEEEANKPPTEEELYREERQAIKQKYNAVPYGRVTIAKEALNNAILRNKEANIEEMRTELEAAIAAELDEMTALDEKYNIYGVAPKISKAKAAAATPIYCYVCGEPMISIIHKFDGAGYRCPDCGRFIKDE